MANFQMRFKTITTPATVLLISDFDNLELFFR